MKRIFLIFKLIFRVKIIFKEPKNYKLVIFDDESIGDLKNVIQKFNYFIMQNRIENLNKVYVSFKLLKFFIKNYKGNIMTAYLVSLLEIIKPRAVITFIDNSHKFFDLARILDNKMNFVAIQNAARYDFKEYKHLYKKKKIKYDFSKKFYIPNFLCFGQFEIDDFKHHGIKVKNFFKVGSLRLANFFYHIKKNKIKIKKFNYDICLISEPAIQLDVTFSEKNVEKSAANTVKFTIKFCMKHNMKFIFVMKRNKKLNPEGHETELNFYKKYLTNNEFDYLASNSSVKKEDKYSSYMSMHQSKVTIGYWSTMLRENLAIGGKILCCNLLPTNTWDFPVKGICLIRNCTFKEFEKRLLQIYSMPKKNYFSKINKDKCYTVKFNKKVSTIEILKNKIDYFLADKQLLKN